MPYNIRDLYEVLGLAADATLEDLKRTLSTFCLLLTFCVLTDPDKNPKSHEKWETWWSEKYIEVRIAYEHVLNEMISGMPSSPTTMDRDTPTFGEKMWNKIGDPYKFLGLSPDNTFNDLMRIHGNICFLFILDEKLTLDEVRQAFEQMMYARTRLTPLVPTRLTGIPKLDWDTPLEWHTPTSEDKLSYRIRVSHEVLGLSPDTTIEDLIYKYKNVCFLFNLDKNLTLDVVKRAYEKMMYERTSCSYPSRQRRLSLRAPQTPSSRSAIQTVSTTQIGASVRVTCDGVFGISIMLWEALVWFFFLPDTIAKRVFRKEVQLEAYPTRMRRSSTVNPRRVARENDAREAEAVWARVRMDIFAIQSLNPRI